MPSLHYFITYLDDEGHRATALPAFFTKLDEAHGYSREIAEDCPGRDARVECLEYPRGSTVYFGDCTATVPITCMGERLVITSGVVTGLPTVTSRGLVYLSVYAQAQAFEGSQFRQKKIMIYAGNIIGVEYPEIRRFEDGIFGGEPLG